MVREAGTWTEPGPWSTSLIPPRAPRSTLTSSGLLRMAAVAAQSRFSSPAGTRPAGKLVSNSTNGMSGGKKLDRPHEQKKNTQVDVPEGRGIDSSGGAPRKPGSLLAGQTRRAPGLAA